MKISTETKNTLLLAIIGIALLGLFIQKVYNS